MTWTDWSDFGLEEQFNPRAALGRETDRQLKFWVDQSALRTEELGGCFDIAYGDHPLMCFDYHPVDAPKIDSPIVLIFHGGYWRALDKADMRHHMADLKKSGFETVNMNYPLCPEVTLTDIVEITAAAITRVLEYINEQGIEPSRPIFLMGHSAGGHLVLHHSHHPGLVSRLKGVVSLSSIIETDVVPIISVNQEIRLTTDEADRWNLISHPPRTGPEYYVAVGGEEPSGWIDQSVELLMLLRERGNRTRMHIVQGVGHFNLVDRMCDGTTADGAKMAAWINRLCQPCT